MHYIHINELYLKRSKAWEGKQRGTDTGGGAQGGGGGDVNWVHERVSVGAADETHNVNDNNLTQSNLFGEHMGGARQHHHNRSQRHREGGGEVGEFGRTNEPKQKHGGANGLEGGEESKATATDGVAEGGFGDYENSSEIGEGWEGHLAAEWSRAVQGGAGDNRARKCSSEGGGQPPEPQGSAVVVGGGGAGHITNKS